MHNACTIIPGGPIYMKAILIGIHVVHYISTIKHEGTE